MTEALVRDTRTSVDKAMSILNAFQGDALTGVGLSELARRAHLPKSTAFRLLGMLQRNNAVERAGNDYRLGVMLQDLDSTRDSSLNAKVRGTLTPYLTDLYSQTRQTVHLAVLRGVTVVYLNKLDGHQISGPTHPGNKAPASCSAVGKVLLAHNPEVAAKILAGDLPRWTSATITDPSILSAELTTARQTNVAFDKEETLRGLISVAGAILAPNGRAVAALAVSGPAGSFTPETYVGVLRRICYSASRAISGTGRTEPRRPAAMHDRRPQVAQTA